MKPKEIKILTLIPSEQKYNNRRKAQRRTWIEEAKKELQAYFISNKQYYGDDDVDNTLEISPALFDGKHISSDLILSVEFFKGVKPEWILFCDNLAYLWIERLLPKIERPEDELIEGTPIYVEKKKKKEEKPKVIGYEGKDGSFYFVRQELIEELEKKEKARDVVKSIKKNKIPIHLLTGITSELKYPKHNNNVIAVVGQRPDKILRIHDRRHNPHIAVITIALGRYDRFFGGWYEAIQEKFLETCTRHYYVFTDADPDSLPYVDCDYCTVIPQKNLGWPGNTRDRFELFLKLKDEIEKNFDYVYFLQVTARLTTKLSESEAIPDSSEGYMWVTRNIDLPNGLTYDPNPRSAAYIPKDIGKIYVQGGAFGGRCKEFFQMCEACVLGLKHNRENGVGEYLNDESHMNHYFVTRTPKEGWLRFWWPADEKDAEKCKVYTLNKIRYGGFRALKEPREKKGKKKKNEAEE